LVKNVKGRDISEDSGIHKRILLKQNIEKQGGKMTGFIYLDQDRDQWWALVNMVMKLWVPLMVIDFFTS
jgi:hypothetical protein